VDAVYIALPNALHHQAVLSGARAGKHLLCEKPFALRVEHAREMIDACERAGIVLRIAHQIRTDQAVGRVRELAQSGALGRIAGITLQRSSVITPRDTWRADAAQSGVIYDVCVHLIDLAQWITGQKIVEVAALSHPDRRLNLPDDTVTVLGRTERDCHVVARATREAPHAGNNLVVEGWEATVTTSPLRWAKEHVLSVKNASGTTEERFPATPAYAWQVQAFEDELLHGRRSVLPDGEDALHTVAVTQAALRSMVERLTVTVEVE
jgi:1,5-anhydro-D-fructose reductase (1,5-anhydro-D-mannitol-forming)